MLGRFWAVLCPVPGHQNREEYPTMLEMKRAVLFMDDETEGGAGLQKPLMLQSVLFCPMLTWLSDALREAGVERFFVLCPEQYREEALACFASVENVTVSDQLKALADFLEGEEKTLVVPGAAVPVDSAGKNEVYAVAGSALANSLRTGSGEVEGAQSVPGFTTIDSQRALNSMQFLGRSKMLRRLLEDGVNVLDPNNTYIDPRVRIGAGTLVLPGTILRGRTVIGQNCEIGPNTMITNCTVGDDTVVNASQINDSTVGSRTNIGPFAYVRPNCTIGDDIKVGDFVEVKNSTLGNGTKISHLTYVGDSDVGEHVNFGCGTVTVNFDGKDKHRCTIGDHVFLGCNTNLVAPVTVGDGAYTAAGSTITGEVPEGSLAIARARQTNLPEWADKRRKEGRLR